MNQQIASIRKKVMINKLLLFLLTAGVCTIVLSCSSDDAVGETILVDRWTVQDYDSISVDFSLLNAEGQAVRTFKEGEQILFRLTVTNKRNTTLRIQNPVYIVGEDLFQVYSSDKQPVGRPWDMYIQYFGPLTHYWSAHKSYVYECAWLGQVIDPDEDIDPPLSGLVLLKNHERQPLPVGSYYTEFKIILNDQNTITCRKYFSIIAK